MTVFDPISGKHVLIDLSEKPRNARGIAGFDEGFLPDRQESSIACKPEPHAGVSIRPRPSRGS
ncbi:hypothetical protein [Microvirga sp. CF3016]|uniref:hypothetical protein n=1 Tax=Microvirga sp. CF3016 TaxID=3110181 RepID=UPI002E769DFA|nr:hypothetical protein [Microvirga sp. CF3016]MEE1612319.1 hypothetical protein [Microvirga sp. CF3016]